MFKSGTVYDDANAEQLDTFDHKQPHRNGNLEILEADEEGSVLVPYTAHRAHYVQAISKATLLHLTPSLALRRESSFRWDFRTVIRWRCHSWSCRKKAIQLATAWFSM
jgi:hypothetical protein